MDCLTASRLLQKIYSYKCQFCTKVWASSKAGLSSSYHVDGWAKYKEKVPDVSDPTENVQNNMQPQTQVYITYRFIYQKGAEKLVKNEYMQLATHLPS